MNKNTVLLCVLIMVIQHLCLGVSSESSDSSDNEEIVDSPSKNTELAESTIATAVADPDPMAESDASIEIPENSGEDIYLLDDFVVTGQRLANRAAIAERMKNDAQFVDTLGGDEMGKLPDSNLGEALGRLPGVSTVEDEGVGRYVTIRGLQPSFVNLTMDGMSLSAQVRSWDADSGRASNFQAVSTNAISNAQVFKTITPDMDGNSIAGTVNLKTKSAYDKPGMQIGTQAAAGWVRNNDGPDSNINPSYKGSFNFNTNFGKDDQFGIVFSGSHREYNRLIIKEDITSAWEDAGKPLYPTSKLDAYTDESAVKQGGFLKFEYKPSEDFYAYASVNYFNEVEEWKKNEHVLYTSKGSSAYDPGTNTFKKFSGLVKSREPEFGTDDAFTYAAGMTWRPSETTKLETKGSFSTSEFYLNDKRAQWAFTSAWWAELNGTYSANGRDWDLNLNDNGSRAAFSNPNSYEFNEFRSAESRNKKDIANLQVDWGHNAEQGDKGWGYKLGAKTTYLEVRHRESNYRFKEPTQALKTRYQGNLRKTEFVSPTTKSLVVIGDMKNIISDVREQGIDEYSKNFNNKESNPNAADYNAEESVHATYFMQRYASDRFSTVFGLRYEYTDYTGEARRFDAASNSANNQPCVENSRDYHHWLPSINASYRFNEKFALRAGYYRGITRPGFDDLKAVESALGGSSGSYWKTKGNPELKPREADSLDLTVEYYFQNGYSMFSAGTFYKNIKNEIFELSKTEFDPSLGSNGENVTVIQAQNANSASMYGAEASIYFDSFEFLPRPLNLFGGQLNYTYTQGKMDIESPNGSFSRSLKQLQNQSEHSINAVLFYQHHSYNARLAARFTSKSLDEINEDKSKDITRDDILRFDLRVDRNLWKGACLFCEVKNLTNDSTYYYGKEDETVKYGRTYWLGLTQNF